MSNENLKETILHLVASIEANINYWGVEDCEHIKLQTVNQLQQIKEIVGMMK